jgi:flagellar biosynthesis protein FlhA
MLLFLALLPGLPFFPFAAIACLTLVTASRVRVLVNRGDATGGSPAGATPSLPEKGSAPAPSTEKPDEDEESAAYVPVQPMCLEIGFGLVPLVDERIGGDLISRLGVIRAQVRQELGIMIPPISVQDNLSLGNNEYRILLRGLERARGEVQVGMHLAINPGDVSGHIEGSRTTDPAFGFDAVWIPGRRVDTAESKGYTVVECSSVITTHATKIVEECAADLLGRQSVSDLLEEVKQTDRAVIEELVPQRLSIGVVHRVLQHLLAEQVPVHDLASILECLSDYSTQSKEPLVLCEFCRQALKGHIVARYVSPDRKLHAVVLEPHLESRLQEFMSDREQGMLAIAPELAESILQQIQATSESAKKRTEHDLVLLVAPGIRPHLSRLVGRVSPLLPVLSYAEISDEVSLQVLGTVPDVEQLEEVPA